MWPRTAEVMLGVWLAASPFIFRQPPGAISWWIDLAAAFVIVTVSLLSFWSRTGRAHLLNILVALWLIGGGYAASGDPPVPAAQNDLLVGLVLLMLAIIPSEATLPPKGWRDLGRGREKRESPAP